MAEYYSQRAGTGLIISEGIPVAPQGVGYQTRRDMRVGCRGCGREPMHHLGAGLRTNKSKLKAPEAGLRNGVVKKQPSVFRHPSRNSCVRSLRVVEQTSHCPSLRAG